MRFGRRADSDFHDEIESHVAFEADRLINEGMSPEEAKLAARRAFGNVALAQERFYESRRWLWFQQSIQDLRYGLRSLHKAPAFTAVVALTIALGVGANTAVFSLIEAVLLRSLPVENPKELVFLETAGIEGASGPPPYPCFSRLRAETNSFAGMAAFSSDELLIEIDGKPEQVMGQVASGNYFKVLGVKPLRGRLLQIEDEKLNAPIVVISERYWHRRFGGNPAAIGKSITFRKRTFTIAGVTPAKFSGLAPGLQVDITFPISIERELMADSGAFWLQGIVARLKPGVASVKAEAESDVVFRSFMSGSRLPADFVTGHFGHLEIRPAAHGTDVLRLRFSKPLYALMGIVVLVLLLAVANIANLLLARGIGRASEFAIRLATGAGQARIARQLLTETLLLFSLGAVPGVVFAGWTVRLVETLLREGRRTITLEAGLNWQVLTFSLMVTLLAALLSGLFPAWRAIRTDPEQAIKDGQSRTTESRSAATWTQALIAFQVSLSLVLLVGAATFVRTLANLRGIDPGFRNDAALTMSLQLQEGFTDPSKYAAFWDRALGAVRRVPAVRAAGISTFTPLSGRDRGGLVRVRGYEPPTSEDATIHINQVSEGYFESLGIPLLRGRLFTSRDADGAAKVAVINESATRKYFGDRDPIGETLTFLRKGGDSSYRIVGVVCDTKHMNLREAAARFAFISIRQPRDAEQRVTFVIASSLPNRQLALLTTIRTALATIRPGFLISEVITIRRQLDNTLLTERLLSGLSSAFGVLAMILASIGLYGVLSYRIGRQRQSIGIRMALGASPSSVALSVLRHSGLVIAIGLLGGLPFACLETRMTNTLLWGVKAGDPRIYIGCAGLLCVIGIAAAYLPARRAAAIEPVIALRHS